MVRNLFAQIFILACLYSKCTLAQGNSQHVVKSLPSFRIPDIITGKGISNKEINLDKWVDQVSNDIVNARPGAFTPNSNDDKITIRSAYQSLNKKMDGAGFTNNDILKALYASWIDLSIKEYDKNLKETEFSEQDLVDKALHMGVLNIGTQPQGAIIRVDSYESGDKTNTSFWVTEGKHQIEIIKNGYIPINEIVNIEPKKVINFQKDLKFRIK